MSGFSVSASAPARVDFTGGTLDIWPLNLMFSGTVTLNMAISIRAHAKVTKRKDRKVILVSEDRNLEIGFSSMEAIKHNHPLGMLSRLAEHFMAPGAGLKIETRSDAPAGAGLAGSSALNIALCGALNRLTGRRLSRGKLIDTAKDIEAALLGVPTGLQDYGAAVYGSVHAFTFPPGGMRREKLRAPAKLIAKRTLLFYSGLSRSSGINNWEMFRRVIEKERKAKSLFLKISKCSKRAVEALKGGETGAFDRAVNDEWDARRKLFVTISTPKIDKAIREGKQAGATAARICGAGGGGCFLLLADPKRHKEIIGAVERTGCRNLTFSLSNSGLKIYNNR